MNDFRKFIVHFTKTIHPFTSCRLPTFRCYTQQDFAMDLVRVPGNDTGGATLAHHLGDRYSSQEGGSKSVSR